MRMSSLSLKRKFRGEKEAEREEEFVFSLIQDEEQNGAQTQEFTKSVCARGYAQRQRYKEKRGCVCKRIR